jgi:hypothetical protein
MVLETDMELNHFIQNMTSAQRRGMHNVAFSGEYSHLTGTPTLGALAALDTAGTEDLDDNAVTCAKIQHIATARVMGRATAGDGDCEELTGAQVQALLPIKLWTGSTTTTSGAWTIDYTAAGFTGAPTVIPTAQLSDANVYDRGWASLSSAPTQTSAAGYGIRGANLALLGATVRTVPDGTIIHVIAIGA